MSADGAPARPARPAYGEYATPEEQLARIRRPDATLALDTGHSLAKAGKQPSAPAAQGAPADPGTPSRYGASAGPRPAGASDSASARRPRTADRIATFALLAYGVVTAVTSIPAVADYGSYADTLLQLLGVDVEYVAPPGARAWGIAAALVLGIGWLAIATVSWLRLRRGLLTWWVPLAGGFACHLISSALMIVPLASDHVVWNAVVAAATG